MRLRVTVELDIDEAGWAHEYAVPAELVELDVLSWLRSRLQDEAGLVQLEAAIGKPARHD